MVDACHKGKHYLHAGIILLLSSDQIRAFVFNEIIGRIGRRTTPAAPYNLIPPLFPKIKKFSICFVAYKTAMEKIHVYSMLENIKV